MDPDANLLAMRELAEVIIADYDSDTTVVSQDDAARLAELVQAMDEWLSKRGFLPKDWKR